ncbi:MAG: hypothetical protein U0236_18775 [Nitrospira sp.]
MFQFQRRMIFLLTLQCLALGILTLVWTSNANAAERRCNDLGANCVCSEPLQATAYINYGTNSHWNPNDTTNLECNGEGLPGAAVVRNAGSTVDLLASTNATALSRLPAGHQVQRFLAGPQNHKGVWFTGHTMPDSTTFAKRIAIRYYIYHSADYTFSNPTNTSLGCNAKLLQFDAGLLGDVTHGAIHMYNFTTWPRPQDCCFEGPGPAGNNLSRSDWLNKWWRVEIVMVNRNAANTGQHWRMQIYLKNVTDGAAEKLVVDTDYPGTQLNPVNPRIPSAVMTKLLVNLYRGENTANQCFGWEGISHYMIAGWNTDAGQRIGAAAEIEGAVGGGGSTTPPPAPTNLRLSFLESISLMASN